MDSNKPLVIITDKVHDVLLDVLAKNGFHILHLPSISYNDLLELIPKATALILTTKIKIDKILNV